MQISSYQRARILMFIASVISAILFLGYSRLAGFPLSFHRGGSFVVEGGAWAFLGLGFVFIASLGVGTLLLGRIRFDGGLVAACLGLGALSFITGDMRSIIQGANLPGKGLFIRLAMEASLLTFMIAMGRLALGLFRKTGAIHDTDEIHHPPSGNALPAFAIQLLATFIALLFFIPRDEKLQALFGVALASFVGVIAAQAFFETPNTGAHWVVPLLLGIFGYAAFAFAPLGAETASLEGTLAPLARPTPLDYAAAGPAGAIIAHWICRMWSRDLKEEEKQDENREEKMQEISPQ